MKTTLRLIITLLILSQCIRGILPSASAQQSGSPEATEQIEPTNSPDATEIPAEPAAATEESDPITPTDEPPATTAPTIPPKPTATAPSEISTTEPSITPEPTEAASTVEPSMTPKPTIESTPTPSPTATAENTPSLDAEAIMAQSDFSAAAIMTVTTNPSGTMPVGTSVTAQSAGLSYRLLGLGTMTYRWYDNGVCSGGGTAAGGGLVLALPLLGILEIPSSSAITMTTLGAKSFSASYSGEATNPAQTVCVAVIAVQRIPTISVTPPSLPVTAGTSRTSTSTLSNSYLAGGTVTYEIFPNLGCTGQPTTTATVAITTLGVMPGSGPMLINRVGALDANLYWRVSYIGNTNNAAASSPCTARVVEKKPTTLSLVLTPTPVTTGVGTVGTPTLEGTVLAAGGDLTYTAYQNSACTLPFTPAVSNVKSVVGGAAPPSDPIKIPLIGTRYVRAVYAGDDNNATSTSTCRSVTVTISAPALAITVNPSTINRTQTAAGTSIFTAASTAATGTVTYRVYANATCTIEVVGKSSTAPVTAGVVSATTTPTAITFETAGQFYWRGNYSGDSNNGAATSTCVGFIVRALPSISVALTPNSIVIGGSTSAVATLSSGTSNASGTVTYATWVNASCTTHLATAMNSSVSVTAGNVPGSPTATFATIGTYYVTANYSGDALNNAAASGCATLSVTAATPLLSMSQSPSPVEIGGTFSYSFVLAGSYGTPTGNVTFSLFPSSACDTPFSGEVYTLGLSGGSIPGSPAVTYTFPGTVWARATYTGDADNLPAATSCQIVNLITGALTASVGSTTLVPLPYSNDPQSNSGQLVLIVSDPRGTAEGWSVSIVVGDFTYAGPSTTQTDIPADNFTLTGIGTPTTITGQPVNGGGPFATSASGSLATSQTIITAAPGSGSGTYSQTLDVELGIPESASAGTYTTTVTVTTSAAP